MNSPALRPLLHVYLADQDWETTSSQGIYHVSRNILAEMVRSSDPGYRIVVSVKPSERQRMVPASLPSWMEVVEVDGPRLWLDHIWCTQFAKSNGVSESLHVKGWIPIRPPKSLRITAILHDCMHDVYAERYPGQLPRAKIAYLRRMTRHTLLRADRVFTISDFSRGELQARYDGAEKLQRIPLGDPLPLPTVSSGERQGLLIFGSMFPHKFTAGTLHLLREWRRRTQFGEPVYVVGPSPIPLESGEISLGRLTDQELSTRLASVRVLIHLSGLEGFGLPLIEAYFRGTPVVYRNEHAFQEVLSGVPEGALDSLRPEDFAEEMDRILCLPQERIQEISEKLSAKFNWRNCVSALLPDPDRLSEQVRR